MRQNPVTGEIDIPRTRRLTSRRENARIRLRIYLVRRWMRENNIKDLGRVYRD